jgi:signal transduction histidine kinase/class 3 adenylate cyclase/DNA-binding NtrC family response regulator
MIMPLALVLAFFFCSHVLQAEATFPSKQTSLLLADGGEIFLEKDFQGLRQIKGEWRFSPRIISEFNSAEFDTLPLQNPLTGNFMYLNLASQTEHGSFILRIKSQDEQKLKIRLAGLVASSTLTLHNHSGKDLLWKDPKFDKHEEEGGRTQVRSLNFPITLKSGDNYLVYSFHQKAFSKGDGKWTNIGMVGPLLIGDSQTVDQQYGIQELLLKIPLGVFACLAIYSFLIYFLRNREDKDSLLLFLLNSTIFIKEFFSQGIHLSFWDAHPWVFSIVSLGVFLPLLATGLCVTYLHHRAPSRYLHYLQIVAYGNFVISVLHSFSFLHISWLPQNGWLTNFCILVNAFVFFLCLIPYTFHASIKSRNLELMLFTVGIGLLGAGTLVDFANIVFDLGWPWWSMIGGMGLSIILAFNNSRMFAQAYATAKHLSTQLQQEVERQTYKLRMQHDKIAENQRELLAAHQELQANDQQKTKFFRSISHELRTPLTLIVGCLQDSQDVTVLRQSMDIAARNAKRLLRLVNQLLDFQKIALSKISLRNERLDLEPLVSGLTQYVEGSCHQFGLTFEVVIPRQVSGGLIVQAQIDALEKIMFNYLANAIKFTPKGGHIKVEISLRGAFIRIAVKDTGCGIPKDQQDKLFKLFSQIDSTQQINKQGTGLGLALAKELAEQMHGRVGVESESGQGSCFWLELPRLVSDIQNQTILFVDPDRKNHTELLQALRERKLECSVSHVPAISEALEHIRLYSVQVLIVSTSMGDDIGSLMEACKELRPRCWRVLSLNTHFNRQMKSINTQIIDAVFPFPFTQDFFAELPHHLIASGDSSKPILDIVYIEDERIGRQIFEESLARYSLIDSYRLVASISEFRDILQTHRIKVLVADANLKDGESGIDVLTEVERLSPETIRILFTGETSGSLLRSGMEKARAHYIIYKPANFEAELRIIQNYINQHPWSRQGETEANTAAYQQWDLENVSHSLPQTIDMETVDAEGPTKATIFVIDDVPDMCIFLRDMLREAGYRVLLADRAQKALERFQKGDLSIDLMICDWMMPGMTGLELIQQVHKIPALTSIPSILLTAKADETSRSQGMKSGASVYLSKPFDKEELLSIVENLLELKKTEREVLKLNQFIAVNVLQRFLPPDLVKDLVAGKAVFDDAARTQPITVLFADLCNFTRSTEKLGPHKIARILNSFLVEMTEVIFAEGGTIDKFIGDGILVFFGAPTNMLPTEQVNKACRAAIKMQVALKSLNDSWTKTENHNFQMRIGIHHGPAIVGSFGGQKRSDYTAIGNTVNLASRIESMAQPGEILISASIRDYLVDDIWELAGSYELKGIEGEVDLYRLLEKKLKQTA